MLLEKYKTSNLVWLTNVDGAVGSKEVFRGDLVVEFGDMHEASQTRNPPKKVFEQVVMVAENDKITFLAGYIEDIGAIADLAERYAPDFDAGLVPILFVLNIDAPLQVSAGGASFGCLPLAEGLVWNELMDLLYVEKSDLKGLSAAEKVETVANEQGEFKPKGEELDAQAAASKANGAQREYAGAI